MGTTKKNLVTKSHLKKIVKFLILKALVKANSDHQLQLITAVDINNYSIADRDMLHLIAYDTLESQDINLKTLNKETSHFENKLTQLKADKEKVLSF